MAKHSFESCSQGISNLTQIISRLIGKFLTLDITPQRLNRIEIRRVSGKPLDSKPLLLLLQVFLHLEALVGR